MSLLYNHNLSGLRLAPGYDMLSTSAYEGSTRQLSVRIGNARSLDEVSLDAFRNAAQEVHLNEKTALKRVAHMTELFEDALTETADELSAVGFS